MAQKLAKLNTKLFPSRGKSRSPIKTAKFWAIVLIPVVVLIAVALCVFYIVLRPGDRTASTFILNNDQVSYTFRGNPGWKNYTEIAVPAEYSGLPVTEIDYNAFKNFTSVTKIIIPDTITKIGDNAFNGCTSLVQIEIPSGVTSIGNSAFKNCSNLAAIDLPAALTQIDGYLFENCEKLEKIVIPASVAHISSAAFKNCTSLTVVFLRATAADGITQVTPTSFDGCDALERIVTPDSTNSWTAYTTSLAWEVYFSLLDIPRSGDPSF